MNDLTTKEILLNHALFNIDSKQGSSANLGGKIIRGLDFHGSDLSSLEARNCLFVNCNFVNVDFYGSEFNDTIFIHCIFDNVGLTKVRFHGSSLINCMFLHSKLFCSELIAARIVSCNFSDADFGGITLSNSLITDTNFSVLNTNDAAICDNDEINVIWTES